MRGADLRVANTTAHTEALEQRRMMARVNGIDVSHFQGTINWANVRAAGYEFAYEKATEAVGVLDSALATNMAGGAAAGVLMGAFHYAKPDSTVNDAVNEANYFVAQAGAYMKGGWLRPAVQVDTGSALGKAALSTWVNTFVSTVESATGVTPLVYANTDYATNYLNTSVANKGLWVANYNFSATQAQGTSNPPAGSWGSTATSWKFWRHSASGTVSGVSGTTTNLDVFNGDREALQALVIPPPTSPFQLNLDFGPATSAPPDGYVGVASQLYGSLGGYTMGWSASGVTTATRTGGSAPDERYRSYAMPALSGVSRAFEVAVPNGSYTVRVVCGSPDQYPNAQKITVEGVTAVNATTSASTPFVTGTVTVTVTDGKLTLGSDYNGWANTRLDFVDIVAAARTSSPPAAPSAVVASVTNGTTVRVVWQDRADNEGRAPATFGSATWGEVNRGYTVKRQAYSGGAWGPWTTLGYALGNGTSYVDATAATGATYRYNVLAMNGAGRSSEIESNVVTMPSVTLTAMRDTMTEKDADPNRWVQVGAVTTGVATWSIDWGDGTPRETFASNVATARHRYLTGPQDYIVYGYVGETRSNAIVAHVTGVASSVFYQNAFEDAIGIEWSKRPTGNPPTQPAGGRFLGEFGNGETKLSLADLPEHEAVTIAFDLLILRSWDGSDNRVYGADRWFLSLDGQTLIDTTFSNHIEATSGTANNTQTWPDETSGVLTKFPAFSGSTAHNSLGYTHPSKHNLLQDSTYRISVTVPHAASALALRLWASGLQSIQDESWAIDNIVITSALDRPVLTATPVPAQAKISLDWASGSGANDFYELQQSDDGSTWRSLPVDGGELTGQTAHDLSDLYPGYEGYFRVRKWRGSDVSPWSDVARARLEGSAGSFVQGVPAQMTEGENATLSMNLAGAMPTSTSWSIYKDGVLKSSVSNASTLNFTPDDNGDYRIVAAAQVPSVGPRSGEARIVVANAAPSATITGVPAAAATPNAPLQFGVAIVDPGAADTHTVSWTVERNGITQLVVEDQAQIDFLPTIGGSYRVVATVVDDDGGRYAVSRAFTVSGVNPVVTISGTTAGLSEGDTLALAMQASPAGGGLSYRWQVYRDGTMVGNSYGETLEFPLEDDGNYRVIALARSPDGEGSADVEVHVANLPPTIGDVTWDKALKDGDDSAVTFWASGVADPGVLDTLAMRWTVSDSDGEIVESSDQPTLTFTPAGTAIYKVSFLVDDGDGGRTVRDVPFTNEPARPGHLLATAVSGTRVHLRWTDPSDLEGRFIVERADGGSTSFAQVGIVAANRTSYVDNAVLPGHKYIYRVVASRNAEDSQGQPFTAIGTSSKLEICTIPEAPEQAIGVEQLSNAVVKLLLPAPAWSDAAVEKNSDWSAIHIEARRSSDLNYVNLGDYPADALDADGNLTLDLSARFGPNVVGEKLFFRLAIKATSASGEQTSAFGPASWHALAIAAPAAATNVTPTVVAGTPGRVNVTWTSDADNVKTFEVLFSSDGENWTKGAAIDVAAQGGQTFAATVDLLASDRDYQFRVRSVGVGPKVPLITSESAALGTRPTPLAMPGLPTSIFSNSTNRKLTVSWTASPNVTNVGYALLKRQVGKIDYELAYTTTSTHADVNLLPGVNYDFKVVAYMGYYSPKAIPGASLLSDARDLGTPSRSLARPVAPTAPTLNAPEAEAGRLVASWTPPMIGEPALYYRVELIERATSRIAQRQVVDASSVPVASFGGLDPSVGYYARIVAINDAGAASPISTDATTVHANGLVVPSIVGWEAPDNYRYNRNRALTVKVRLSPTGSLAFNRVSLVELRAVDVDTNETQVVRTADPAFAAYMTAGGVYASVALELKPGGNYRFSARVSGGGLVSAWGPVAATESSTTDVASTTLTRPPTLTSEAFPTSAKSTSVGVRAYGLTGVVEQVRVEVATSNDFSSGAIVRSITRDVVIASQLSDISIQGLAPGTYYVRTWGLNSVDSSAAAPSSAFTIATPTTNVPTQESPTWIGLLDASAYDANSLKLTFQPATNAAAYQVSYRRVGTGPWITEPLYVATTADNKRVGILGRLAPDTAYDVYVSATNPVGSDASNEARASTRPFPTPTDLVAEPQSATSIRLDWSETNRDETTFDIEISTDGEHFQEARVTGGLTSNGRGVLIDRIDDEPLRPGTNYVFRVRSRLNNLVSNWSDTVEAETQAMQPPSAPSELHAINLDDGRIKLDWAHLDANRDVTRYEVLLWRDGLDVPDVVVDSGQISELVLRLAPAGRYDVRVRAANPAGMSMASELVTILSPADAPLNPVALATGYDTARISWLKPSGGDIVYRVERRAVAGTSESEWMPAHAGTLSTEFANVLSVAPGDQFRVIAIQNGVDSAPTKAVDVTLKSAGTMWAPSGTVTASSVTLKWNDLAGATGYRVDRYDAVSESWVVVQATGPQLNYEEHDLPAATNFKYRVVAVSRLAAGDAAEVTVTTSFAPTPAPTVVESTATDVSLTWPTMSADVTAIEVRLYSAQGTPLFYPSRPQFAGDESVGTLTTDDLFPATVYRVAIVPYYNGEPGPESPRVAFTTPAFPMPPAINAFADADAQAGSVVVRWSVLGSGVPTEFLIERRSIASSTWDAVGTVAGNVRSFRDEGAVQGGTYQYRMTARNGDGRSAPALSEQVSTPPAAPTGFALGGVARGLLSLTWDNAYANASRRSGVRYRLDGGEWTAAISGGGVQLAAVLDSGSVHTVELQAVSLAGGRYSTIAASSFTVPQFPSRPAMPSVVEFRPRSIELALPAFAADVLEVQIFRNHALVATLPPAANRYLDTSVQSNVAYSYFIVARNGVGESDSSPIATVTTPIVPPSGLGVRIASGHSTEWNWTPSETPGVRHELYEARSVSGPWTLVAKTEDRQYFSSGPVASGSHYFKVVAIAGASGANAASEIVAVESLYPDAPQNLRRLAGSNASRNRIAWDAVAGASQYRVYSRSTGGGWDQGTSVAGTTYTDTALTFGAVNFYRVVAVNSHGESGYADLVTTPGPRDPLMPQNVIVRSAGTASDGRPQMRLTFDLPTIADPAESTHVVGYEIQRSTKFQPGWLDADSSYQTILFDPDGSGTPTALVPATGGGTHEKFVPFEQAQSAVAGNTYFFRVRTVVADAQGQFTSSYSVPIYGIREGTEEELEGRAFYADPGLAGGAPDPASDGLPMKYRISINGVRSYTFDSSASFQGTIAFKNEFIDAYSPQDAMQKAIDLERTNLRQVDRASPDDPGVSFAVSWMDPSFFRYEPFSIGGGRAASVPFARGAALRSAEEDEGKKSDEGAQDEVVEASGYRDYISANDDRDGIEPIHPCLENGTEAFNPYSDTPDSPGHPARADMDIDNFYDGGFNSNDEDDAEASSGQHVPITVRDDVEVPGSVAGMTPISIAFPPGWDRPKPNAAGQYASDKYQISFSGFEAAVVRERTGRGSRSDPYRYASPASGMMLVGQKPSGERFIVEPGSSYPAWMFIGGGTSGTIYASLNEAGPFTISMSGGGLNDSVKLIGELPDVDIDADNTSDGAPDATPEEEDAEARGAKKILVVNDGDKNDNGKIDFAEFGGIEGAKFVPIVLELPVSADVSKAHLIVSYAAASDPGKVKSEGSGAEAMWLPDAGSFRLWTKDQSQSRDAKSVFEGGDFIPLTRKNDETGKDEAAVFKEGELSSLLHFAGGKATVYLEAVRPGSGTVSISVDPDGVDEDRWTEGHERDDGPRPFIASRGISFEALRPIVADAQGGPVRAADGATFWRHDDLVAPVDLPLKIGRLWTRAVEYGQVTQRRGADLFWPQVMETTGGIVALLGDLTIYFDRVADGFRERFGEAWDLVPGEEDGFDLTGPTGEKWSFGDTAESVKPGLRGLMTGYVSSGGESVDVTQSEEFERITKVSWATGKSSIELTYDKSGDDGYVELRSAKLKGGDATQRTVNYEYFDHVHTGGTGPMGGTGQLKSITTLDSDGTTIGREYFHVAQYSTSTRDEDVDVEATPIAMTDAAASAYLANRFGGSILNATKEAIVAGATVSESGRAFAALGGDDKVGSNGQPVSNGGTLGVSVGPMSGKDWVGVNRVSTVGTTTVPGKAPVTAYRNAWGQLIAATETITNPIAATNAAATIRNHTANTYDAHGRLVRVATPAAVESLHVDQDATDPTYYKLAVDLRPNEGLIQRFDYEDWSGDKRQLVKQTLVRRGENGSDLKQQSFTYAAIPGFAGLYLPAQVATFVGASDAQGVLAELAYAEWKGAQPGKVTSTSPAPGAAGGSPIVTVTKFDSLGRVRDVVDGDGYRTETTYLDDDGLSVMTKRIVHYDLNDDGKRQTLENIEWDEVGRILSTKDAKGQITTIGYEDGADFAKIITKPATGPRAVTYTNFADRFQDERLIARDSEQTLAWTRDDLDAGGRTKKSTRYHDLDGVTYDARSATLPGAAGTNYVQQTYKYAVGALQTEFVDGAGVKHQTIYDSAGRVKRVQLNGEILRDYEHDNSGSGAGNVTKVIQKPGSGGDNRETKVYYDWRNRPVITSDGIAIEQTTYDYRGRPEKVTTYDASMASVNTASAGSPTVQASANAKRAEYSQVFDNLDRVTGRSQRSIDSEGNVGSATLETRFAYDGRGNLTGQLDPTGRVTQTTIDGRGLVTRLAAGAGTDPAAAGLVAVTEVLTDHDENGNAILVTTRELNHAGGGYRTSYVGREYDAADRVTRVVDFGTNGGMAVAADASLPARVYAADGRTPYLVTDYTYDAAGRPDQVTDPRGVVTKTYYDAAGRLSTEIDAYTEGGQPTEGSNRRTWTQYRGDDQVQSVTEIFDGGSMKTAYEYDDSGHLKLIKHPSAAAGGSGGPGNETTTKVNLLGETVSSTDRNGLTHTYTRDQAGRVTLDSISGGAGIDTSVRAIRTTYDALGRLTAANTLGTRGTALVRKYNGFGQLLSEQQEIGANVDATSPTVTYGYSSAATGSSPASISYPSGRTLTYGYATDIDRAFGRITSTTDSVAGVVETIQYAGGGHIVARAMPEAGLSMDYFGTGGDGGDGYAGLDRFGRVLSQKWMLNGTLVDGLNYEYDAGSNLLVKANLVNNNFSELLHGNAEVGDAAGADPANRAYDNFGRLKSWMRGPVSKTGASHYEVASGTEQRTQSWSYDALGNWLTFFDGKQLNTTGYDAQSRAKSDANNTYHYDNAGALVETTNGTHREYKYDGWGRATEVKVFQGASTTPIGTAEYWYDALGRLVRETPAETLGQRQLDFIHDASGHVIEERSHVIGATGPAATSSAYRENVWSAAGGRLLFVEDQNPDAGGMPHPTRLYALSDAQGNTSSVLMKPDGLTGSYAVKERFAYDPNGRAMALKPDWSAYDMAGGVPYGNDPASGWDKSVVDFRWLWGGLRWSADDRLYHDGGTGQSYDPVLAPSVQPRAFNQAITNHWALTNFAVEWGQTALMLQGNFAGAQQLAEWGGFGDYSPGMESYRSDDVGLGEGLIPVWGSGKQAYLDFENGRYVEGVANTINSIGDAIAVGYLARSGIRAAARGTANIAAFVSRVGTADASRSLLITQFRRTSGKLVEGGGNATVRQARALLREAADASGQRLSDLVDEIRVGADSGFGLREGRRVLTLSDATLRSDVRATRLRDAFHELFHASRYAERGYIPRARTLDYAREEVKAEIAAIRGIESHLGSANRAVKAESLEYIKEYRARMRLWR